MSNELLTDEEIVKILEKHFGEGCCDDQPDQCYQDILKAQAELSFNLAKQEGAREVIEEIEKRARAGELSWCGYEYIGDWGWLQALKERYAKIKGGRVDDHC